MKILFLHQNMPGQFTHLARHLAAVPGNEVVFVTKRRDVTIPGVRRVVYEAPKPASPETHHYLRNYENAVRHGQQVVRVAQALQAKGFRPDIVVAHPGWGESLFVKDVFPGVPLLNYCEFFYRSHGADVGYDPSEPVSLDTICRIRARNAHLLVSLEACDRGLSPTQWQRSVHPEPFRSKIEVIFDGIDTRTVRPDPQAHFDLPNGRRLTRSDEVITYVARNLEPYRGFPSFMRALPEILARRPRAEVVIVGGDEVSYGRGPENHKTWREAMLAEVELDQARVHFHGRIPYDRYLSLLRISAAHVYLTVPFVLSWSFMEAMAAGCVLVASDTAPVLEVLRAGENGFLTSLLSPARIAEDVLAALDDPRRDAIRRAARETVLERYDLARCLPRQVELIGAMAGRA